MQKLLRKHLKLARFQVAVRRIKPTHCYLKDKLFRNTPCNCSNRFNNKSCFGWTITCSTHARVKRAHARKKINDTIHLHYVFISTIYKK